MFMNRQLGEPSERIRQWIVNHNIQPTPPGPQPASFWDQLVDKLENFGSSDLPQVKTYLTVPYKVDPEGEAVDTDWQILGYNASIPKYVKYKDASGNKIYVDVFPDTTPTASLITDFTQAKAYANKDGTNFVGDVENPSGTFTYGNNNTYTVPASITVNGNQYSFCGYNVTIISKCGLAAKFEGNLYKFPQFRSKEKSNQNRNDWKTSEIREWLNGTEAISTQKWYPQSGSATTGTIVGLLNRLPDVNFMKNIISTVNRTWVYSSWRTDQSVAVENYVDKFWLLGEGNVNGNSSYLKDDLYDTSKFTDIFTDDNSRIRKIMNEDGTEDSAQHWWLRSASSGSIGSLVSYDGHVSNYNAYNYSTVLPVCLIG